MSRLLAPILSFIVFSAPAAYAQTALTILYSSEHHGTVQPIDGGPHAGEGGVERRATLIDRIRRETDHVLVVDSGDLLLGTAMSSFYRGDADVAAFNLMRYDAVAVGNHDFDFGVDRLRQLQRQAEFPFLCTNARPRTQDVCKPWVVKSIGPIRIGLIGLIGKKSYPDTFNRSVIGEIEFQDPIAAAKQAAQELRERVDLFIAVTHQDTDEDLALAKAVPALDVIIGGHTEGFDGLVPQGADRPVQGRTELVGVGPIFVKTHRLGRTLGRLDILFHEKTIMVAEAQNLPVTPAVPADPEMAKLVQELVQEYVRRMKDRPR